MRTAISISACHLRRFCRIQPYYTVYSVVRSGTSVQFCLLTVNPVQGAAALLVALWQCRVRECGTPMYDLAQTCDMTSCNGTVYRILRSHSDQCTTSRASRLQHSIALTILYGMMRSLAALQSKNDIAARSISHQTSQLRSTSSIPQSKISTLHTA